MNDTDNKNAKFKTSIDELEHALSFKDKVSKDRFYFSGISKTFETCIEYAWKYFKRKAVDESLEIYSPKDAVKAAGGMGIIDNVENWLGYINNRNLAVHDYLGISDEEYLASIENFLIDVKKISIN